MGGRRWTEEELAYLEKYFGRLSNASLANKLNRSERSVKLKVNRLGYGPKISYEGLISLHQVYILARGKTSLHTDTRLKWKSAMEKDGIKIYSFRLYSSGNRRYLDMMALEDFWDWAEKHPDFINLESMEDGVLGPEPMWLTERRRAL